MATFLRTRFDPKARKRRKPKAQRKPPPPPRVCTECGGIGARKKTGLCKVCTQERHVQRKGGFLQRLASLGYPSYEAYLASDHWKAIRARQPPTPCVRCGAVGQLQLHHQTYKRLGQEDPADLAWLCRPCHRIVHKGKKLRVVRG